MTVVFLTSAQKIPVEDDRVEQLVARLARTSTIRKAIESRDERGVRLTSDEKSELRGVLEDWLRDAGISDLGDGFAELRYELMRDTGDPRFKD